MHAELYSAPKHPYAQMLLAAVPRGVRLAASGAPQCEARFRRSQIRPRDASSIHDAHTDRRDARQTNPILSRWPRAARWPATSRSIFGGTFRRRDGSPCSSDLHSETPGLRDPAVPDFAVTVIFVLVRLAPGDPVDFMLGETGASAEFIEQMRKDLGLDQPIYLQYIRYVGDVATGNLGYSYASRAPVFGLILERFPATILSDDHAVHRRHCARDRSRRLSVRRPNSVFDNTVTVLSLASFAIPAFWLGQMMILVFGYHLDLFPIQGMYDLRAGHRGFAVVLDVAYHMVLAGDHAGPFEPGADYPADARQHAPGHRPGIHQGGARQGLSERVVLLKHALPNALLPVVTVIGMEFPGA